MAILSDADIRDLVREHAAVTTEDGPDVDLDLQLGPSSIDLRLGYSFGVLNTRKVEVVDTKNMAKYHDYINEEHHAPEDGVIVHPGEFLLGTSLETVRVPDDLVARVEGRSSYGRLGIVVHASLPYEEQIFFWTEENGYHLRSIGEIVENRVAGKVVGFDPERKTVERFPVTDFITNPSKDLYRVKTQRGREVVVTEDHNVFTLDEDGEIDKVESGKAEGTYIAVPGSIPLAGDERPSIDLLRLFADTGMEDDIMVHGSGIMEHASITNKGMMTYYQENETVPLSDLDQEDYGRVEAVSFKQSPHTFPVEMELSPQFAYVAGFFLAEGYSRRKQLTFTNKNAAYMERVTQFFDQFDVGMYEHEDDTGCTQITVSSAFLSRVFAAMSIAEKRISKYLFNLPEKHLSALLQGLTDGDASVRGERIEYYTTSENLASDIQYLCSLLGIPSSVTHRTRENPDRDEYRVEIRERPHKLLQGIPVPTALLKDIRSGLDLTAQDVASGLGRSSKTSVTNIEAGYYETVKRESLQQLASFYRDQLDAETDTAVKEKVEQLRRIAFGDLLFDQVQTVEKLDRHEVTYDLEVCPMGKKIENFLGGRGGIFLSNTAGYVDPGFEGQITLEMQNLGNAPVKLYPEDRICQLVFETMTSEAETPYGAKRDSKYMGQRGATSSRLDREQRD